MPYRSQDWSYLREVPKRQARLAQLETMVELQQLQIEEMNKWRHGHMSGEHNATQPRPNASEARALVL